MREYDAAAPVEIDEVKVACEARVTQIEEEIAFLKRLLEEQPNFADDASIAAFGGARLATMTQAEREWLQVLLACIAL